MRLKHVAIITTAAVIILGFAMISPLFLRHNQAEAKPKLMLGFTVSQEAGAAEWCRSLGLLLEKYDIGASVFIPGKTAEQNPQCVSCFNDRVDIGSVTYSNIDLTGIADYSLKLQEVREGKAAVDKAGNLSSGIFRAPFGMTDQDIFSLLSRSGIRADFSYPDHFNVFRNGQFIKFDAAVYAGRESAQELFSSLPGPDKPVVIYFDNSFSIAGIDRFLSGLKKDAFKVVNASGLTELALTDRN